MIDIYKGTLGVFFDRDKVVNALQEYLIKATIPLNYEFKEDMVQLVIITGRNQLEKDIPYFQHPLIFNTVNGREAVAIDLRRFMKSKLDNMITVREYLSDRYNGDLQLMRLVFTKLMLENRFELYTFIKPNILEAFGDIISTYTAVMTYDRNITDRSYVAAKLHMATLDVESDNIDLEKAVSMLPRQDITKLYHGDYKDILKSLKNNEKNIKLPSRTIGDMVELLKATIDNPRAEGLSADLYVQVLSRGFYSFDSKELAIGICEHKPTLLAVLNQVIKEGINAKSKFRQIMNSYKRWINPRELAEQITKTYEASIMQ